MAESELARLTSPGFKERAAAGSVVIIPFGSLEAHGPHLPLGTDTFQAQAVAREAAHRTGALLAPAVPYGVCLSTRDHPGTAGITTGTLQRLLSDLVRAFRRQGITAFLLLSGHAGRTHLMALRDAAETLLLEDRELRLALVSEYDLIREVGADLLTTADDRHAGELETSRMLALAPDLVRGSAPAEYPAFPAYLLTADKVGHWPGSVWGDPGQADPDKGRALLERSVATVCDIIHDLMERRPGGERPDGR